MALRSVDRGGVLLVSRGVDLGQLAEVALIEHAVRNFSLRFGRAVPVWNSSGTAVLRILLDPPRIGLISGANALRGV